MALDVEKYRKRLIEERDRLDRQIGTFADHAQPVSEDGVFDPADMSQQEVSQEVDQAITDMRSHRYEKIAAALQRLDHGTYGTCIKCGKQIDPKRLDAEPTALTCMDCLSAEEKNFTAPTL